MFFRSKKKKLSIEEKPEIATSPDVMGHTEPLSKPVDTVHHSQPVPGVAAAKTKKDPIKTFGRLVALLMNSPVYGTLSLTDLQWFLLPALQRRQFAVAEASSNESNRDTPVGFVMWAMVSEEIDRHLTGNRSLIVHLDPADWAGGSIPWFVCAVGPENVTTTMIRQVMARSMNVSQAKVRYIGSDGTAQVRAVQLQRPA